MADEDRDDLEGNLRSVTDREWFTRHERLMRENGREIPDSELAYVWEPTDG